MNCRDVMKTFVYNCDEDAPVAECARLMRDRNVGFIPVLDDERQVAGVVTDRDLVVRVLAAGRTAQTPVSEVMTHDVRVCRPDDDLRLAEQKMAEARKSRLVVVDDRGRCVGVISLSDVAQADSRARAGQVLHEVTHRETVELVPTA
jgi:CBS domain-containing protein